jgi:hypothetical protein
MPIIRKIMASSSIGKLYKKLLAAIAFYVFFLFCNSAYSVTLEECKVLCLRNSNVVKAYENLIQASVSANRKDKSELFPQISGFYQPNYLVYDKDVDFAEFL